MALAFYQQTDVGENALRRALLDLGKSWLAGNESFSARFITPATAICDNVLLSWPDTLGPHDSLVLLSQDIEAYVRYHAQEHQADYFGLTLTANGTSTLSAPYTLLYDLKLGRRLQVPEHTVASDGFLRVGYAPLEDRDIERYLALRSNREYSPVTDQALDALHIWQKSLGYVLASAAADLSQALSDPTGLSSALSALGGLLRQSRSMHLSILQTQSQRADQPKQSQHTGNVRMQSRNMRESIMRQLTNTALPEHIRAALRHSLKDLLKVTRDNPVPLVMKQPQAIPAQPSGERQINRNDRISAGRNVPQVGTRSASPPESILLAARHSLNPTDKLAEKPPVTLRDTHIGAFSIEQKINTGVVVSQGKLAVAETTERKGLPAERKVNQRHPVALETVDAKAVQVMLLLAEARAEGTPAITEHVASTKPMAAQAEGAITSGAEAAMADSEKATLPLRMEQIPHTEEPGTENKTSDREPVKATSRSVKGKVQRPFDRAAESAVHIPGGAGEAGNGATSPNRGNVAQVSAAESAGEKLARMKTKIEASVRPDAVTTTARRQQSPPERTEKPDEKRKEKRPFDRVAQASGHPDGCACEVCTGTAKSRVDVAPVSAADKLARMKRATAAAGMNANGPAPYG